MAALTKTQRLAREHLGIDLVTFGAPFNATDDTTIAALEAIPTFTVWLYAPRDAQTRLVTFPGIDAVNVEYPVHEPSFDQFKAGFEANLDAEVLVIQGHPRSWVDDPERLEEFIRIVDFLIDRGVAFARPGDFVLSDAASP